MEPLNDNELRELLRQWDAPAAPAHLERIVFGDLRKNRWHRWLMSGAIRVPVPVLALLMVALVSALTMAVSRKPEPPVQEISLSDFQPVSELKPRVYRRANENN